MSSRRPIRRAARSIPLNTLIVRVDISWYLNCVGTLQRSARSSSNLTDNLSDEYYWRRLANRFMRTCAKKMQVALGHLSYLIFHSGCLKIAGGFRHHASSSFPIWKKWDFRCFYEVCRWRDSGSLRPLTRSELIRKPRPYGQACSNLIKVLI